MREAGRHVAEILLELREIGWPRASRPATSTRYAEKAIAERGVESSFKGYDPYGLPKYPAVLCVSVNDEIVHGIPGQRTLEDGDIVSLDFGVSVDGYHGRLRADRSGRRDRRPRRAAAREPRRPP